jgi:mannosyltransferase OCH1-like enzyme
MQQALAIAEGASIEKTYLIQKGGFALAHLPVIDGKIMKPDALPLGPWRRMARNARVVNGTLSCDVQHDGGKSIIIPQVDHRCFYQAEDDQLVPYPLKLNPVLPPGDWILSAMDIRVDTAGVLSCRLAVDEKSGIYLDQTLSLNDDDSDVDGNPHEYKNAYGNFFRVDRSPALLQELEAIPPIPRKIYQTHKSLDYVLQNRKTRMSHDSWKRYCHHGENGFEYVFFDDAGLDAFMATQDERIYRAFQRCPMRVMQADLWRYCVLYEHGGIYADADAVLMKGQDPSIFLQEKAWLVLAPETDRIHLCQWTFAAPPRSPVLRKIIDTCVERILNAPTIRGEHIIHFMTGPRAFTDGVESYLKERQCTLFRNKLCYEVYQNYHVHIFNTGFFHGKLIHHLFAGNDHGGWKNERYGKIV